MSASDFNDWHQFQEAIMRLFFLDGNTLSGVLKYFLYAGLAQFVYNELNDI